MSSSVFGQTAILAGVAPPSARPGSPTLTEYIRMDIDGKNLVALKPCLWVAGSRDDMRAFPDRVKRDMGAALMYAQAGGRSGSARQLKGLGPGVVEIVENHDGDTYRCVYLLRLKGVIYVLHAFQKKSKTGIRTPQKDVDLIRSRIRLAEEDHRTRERK